MSTKRRGRLAPLVGIPLLSACGAGYHPQSAPPLGITVIPTVRTVADTQLLQEVAEAFYAGHADEYDMLVLWGAAELSPSTSYYLPIKNDVPGLEADPDGSSLFDHSNQFGSSRLQGIVWMGPGWLFSPAGSGPRSVLGILAQETAHRWGATLAFLTDAGKPSGDLIGSPYHWSFFLDTGSSPLGGNEWVPLGGGRYLARPVHDVRFCALDLYLMGLVTAEEVSPLSRLVSLRKPDGSPDTRFKPDSHRVAERVVVHADVEEVEIGQIIAVQGRREPEVGFNARQIRQAWIYVTRESPEGPSRALEEIERFRLRWPKEFARMTDGGSSMRAE